MIRRLHKALVYGCVGLLVEAFFTGIWSAFHGDWRLMTTGSLWMLLVYSQAGLVYDWLWNRTSWRPVLMAAAYLPLIYCQELLWGLVFKSTVGYIWNYGHHWWTPTGLVNFAYAPLWFGLIYLLAVYEERYEL